jgi:hypothetical protein
MFPVGNAIPSDLSGTYTKGRAYLQYYIAIYHMVLHHSPRPARCLMRASPSRPSAGRVGWVPPLGKWGQGGKAMDDDHLYDAFSAVYLDLSAHGLCRFDPEILEGLWRDFVADMAAGFPSLFLNAQPPAPH